MTDLVLGEDSKGITDDIVEAVSRKIELDVPGFLFRSALVEQTPRQEGGGNWIVASLRDVADLVHARGLAEADREQLRAVLDSLIEIGASTVVLWQLRNANRARTATALRLLAWAFLAIALYLAVMGTLSLATGHEPNSSPLGIAWTAATVVAMLALAAGKHHTGLRLANPVLVSEARVTVVDSYLAAAVLLGLTLNATLGWWWADPLAGFVIVTYGIREWSTLRGEASELRSR